MAKTPTHQQQRAGGHDEVTRPQKTTWCDQVKQVLLQGEVAPPDDHQHEGHKQGTSVVTV
jgi:hypothetical protein